MATNPKIIAAYCRHRFRGGSAERRVEAGTCSSGIANSADGVNCGFCALAAVKDCCGSGGTEVAAHAPLMLAEGSAMPFGVAAAEGGSFFKAAIRRCN